MRFIDEVTITVKAGDGGTGIKHWRREKFVPQGGPDGGNGGAGGSVIVRADRNLLTLLDFKHKPKWNAENGQAGAGSLKDGRAGKDLLIRVPVGTEIFDGETLIADLHTDEQEFVLAQGGRGGKGNAFFKSATNQAPEHFQPGEAGQHREVLLSLKLVADVGLIGFPNAGKSTLISRISAAKPKIADYPFTTLVPNLGVAAAKGGRSFVVADIPGLIPGAHQGKGLGIKFLKHIERTAVLAHLIDPLMPGGESMEAADPFGSYERINAELKAFSPILAERKQIVVLTKKDAISDSLAFETVVKRFKDKGIECFAISSVSGEGLEQLVDRLAYLVEDIRRSTIVFEE